MMNVIRSDFGVFAHERQLKCALSAVWDVTTLKLNISRALRLADQTSAIIKDAEFTEGGGNSVVINREFMEFGQKRHSSQRDRLNCNN